MRRSSSVEKSLSDPARISRETWLWIELIGFDNEKSDLGVGQYFEETGFVPESVSLLMFTADFVHTHDRIDKERVFPPDFCSYNARPYSEQRPRQAWTNFQLRELVNHLQRHGVSVYFSVFNMYSSHSEWAKHHPEILETTRSGQKLGAINVLRRLSDGRFYEDFFIEQVGRVLDDYGFDGFHAADGYSSPRNPICDIDYSDDMVTQFADHLCGGFPADLASACDQDPDAMERRADWIWTYKRMEWIQFYAERWEQYCRKLVGVVHSRGKRVVLNSTWTRDPFEALYRYGIDYQRLAATGIDGFVVETVAPSANVYGLDTAKSHYAYAAMLMLIKAYTRDVKLICLTCIKDTLEQWDALRHNPAFLERDTYGLANMYAFTEQGALERCSAGVVGCLSDSVLPSEWEWLQKVWDVAYSVAPMRVNGITLVWSDLAFKKQLADFVESRKWSTHKLIYELLMRGAPICAVSELSRLHSVKGPILVVYPELLTDDELYRVQSHKGGVVMIGTSIPTFSHASVYFEDVYGPDQLISAVWHGREGINDLEPAAINPKEEEIPADLVRLKEPSSWLYDLYFRSVSDDFLRNCADLMAHLSKSPKVVAGVPDIKTLVVEKGANELRLFISNDGQHYVIAKIDIGETIEHVEVVTRFPGVPVSPVNSVLSVRVPAGGMVILDVTTSGNPFLDLDNP